MSVPKIPVMDFTEIEAVINLRKLNRLFHQNKTHLCTEGDEIVPVAKINPMNSSRSKLGKSQRISPEGNRQNHRTGVRIDQNSVIH